MPNIKEVGLFKYLNPNTNELEGVDIIAYIGSSSQHIASIRSYDDALTWAEDQHAPIRVVESFVDMHGDTPVFNIFESLTFKEWSNGHPVLVS